MKSWPSWSLDSGERGGQSTFSVSGSHNNRRCFTEQHADHSQASFWKLCCVNSAAPCEDSMKEAVTALSYIRGSWHREVELFAPRASTLMNRRAGGQAQALWPRDCALHSTTLTLQGQEDTVTREACKVASLERRPQSHEKTGHMRIWGKDASPGGDGSTKALASRGHSGEVNVDE